MSVVISEFEVVAEPEPAADRATAAPPAAEADRKAPAPNEMARLSQLLAERALRVWAH